ncbi:BRO family protein [Termitidicoccus mucosus]|uniref:Bro-N domain-containing protein n=1 Tax=Termitidicoccus mucosus TaxID=1184151 RepID=A0A178IKF1_9BACT|nr:hypothetical protein AW736_00575 [Opitutaceae bacterium TSB47]
MTHPHNHALSFFSHDAHDVRAITIRGEPWFVAADVCRALDLQFEGGATRYLGYLSKDQKRLCAGSTLNRLAGRPIFRGHKIALISESGLYLLIFRAHRCNPTAERFRDWVTSEVLPAIHRDGAYFMGEERVRTGEMSEEALMEKADRLIQEKLKRIKQLKDRKLDGSPSIIVPLLPPNHHHQ